MFINQFFDCEIYLCISFVYKFCDKTKVRMEKLLEVEQEKKYFVKGSGTSHCLINGSIED